MDLTAQNSVLGSMLIDADMIAPVLCIVRADDFAEGAQRKVFCAIRDMYRDGKAVDAITVADRLGWRKNDGAAYLAELLETTPTSANAVEYAEIVRDEALLNAIRAIAVKLATEPTLDECRTLIAAMTETLGTGSGVDARSLRELLEDFGEAQLSNTAREYISLGFESLDRNTFLEPGDMLMIGGAPSDGKTALGLQIAYHIAQRRAVGFYSLETGYKKLRDRIAALAYDLSFGAIKRRTLTENDWDIVARRAGDAERRRLTVVQAAGMTADQIEASAKARGFEVIVIDYGQLITPSLGKGSTRAEQMADVSRSLHTFAQTSGMLVILLLQLTRKERGSSRARDMFDFGESSQFERDADLVLLLDRPSQGTEYSFDGIEYGALDAQTTRILRVAKQKEGRRVDLPLHFDGDKQRFSVLASDGRAAMRKYADAGRAAKDRNRAEGWQMRFAEISGDYGAPF